MEEVVRYDYWQKARIFVREVSGRYEDLWSQMYARPRVIKSKKLKSVGGPVTYNKFVISPQIVSLPILTQVIETHILTIAPGGWSQKHGHMNSAVIYVLEGKGYDIHDGIRLEWEAGDAYVVRNACVHQHFNSSVDKPVRAVVFKAKPLFLFFNLLFQKTVEWPPEKRLPGFEDWDPDSAEVAPSRESGGRG